MVEVYKGYWHGEVAIKKFILPDASQEQIAKFKDEVSILKKTRHENLALFMGASLTPPDLAIVTRYVLLTVINYSYISSSKGQLYLC